MDDTALKIDNETIAAAASAAEADGWEYCFLEIMGHRSHWGRSREEERFGSKMVRIDVPIEGDPAKGWATHYYGGASIFSYSLTDEATVMRRNKPYEAPSRLAIAAPDDDDFDDGGPYNQGGD